MSQAQAENGMQRKGDVFRVCARLKGGGCDNSCDEVERSADGT